MRCRLPRDAERRNGAAFCRILQQYFSAVQRGDFADQCEAEASAFRGAVGAGEGEEALEKALVGIVGDAGTLVLHADGNMRGVGAGGAGDRAADG